MRFQSVIPLHLAAQMGHIAVVGMLLSRSTQQQHIKDWRGRTPLHLGRFSEQKCYYMRMISAAMNGHYDMVSLLIAQGSNINVMDQVLRHWIVLDIYDIFDSRTDGRECIFRQKPDI